ncbi:MAG TPA: CDP-alcohol phosphatidyltransferase family protein, partial [Sphingomicrobium sp.]|nr:CDP-alcohol phosphatidyltransferase family protein [Sphingomicrobium sp.]
MVEHNRPVFIPVGTNPVRIFGLKADERACRLAANAGFEVERSVPPGRASVLANLDYAWDPAWLKLVRDRPGSILQLDGVPVLAHLPVGHSRESVEQAIAGEGGSLHGLEPIDAATAEVTYDELRKRERPFVLPLRPDTADEVERAAYDASYKGVTDALTLYLWRKPAFYLTRWAAEAGVTPNAITGVGAVLCLLAFFYFWFGNYWLGILAGF